MSCCGGNCGCGSSCKCGNGCGGCKMYPDMETINATENLVVVGGVSPVKKYFDGGETEVAGENGGCKCGPNCTCNPCTCK